MYIFIKSGVSIPILDSECFLVVGGKDPPFIFTVSDTLTKLI